MCCEQTFGVGSLTTESALGLWLGWGVVRGADIRDGVLGEAGVRGANSQHSRRPGGRYIDEVQVYISRASVIDSVCVCVCVSVPLSVSLPIVAYLCTFGQGPVYLRCR